MALVHKQLATFDVTPLGNGTAQLVIALGPIEMDVRLDTDQVDDLQSTLEEVGHQLEEYHRRRDLNEYGEAQRQWRQ